MAQVLCIDTEPETIQAIQDAGHVVEHGEVGFRTGRPLLVQPPHEFDLLICDLRRPACFDTTYWGPGKNDNYHCKIEKLVEDICFHDTQGNPRPKFEIIHPSQMLPRSVGTFGPTDVFTAVNTGGIPFVLFLNKEWLRHVGYSSPNFSDVWWKFERTKATKLSITPTMDKVLSNLDGVAELAVPLEFAIAQSAHRQGVGARNPFVTVPLVTNAVSQVFGEAVILEKGAIWAMPPFHDNASICVKLLDRFEWFLSIQSSLLNSTGGVAPATDVKLHPQSPVRDVFISHASEDKAEIARPLAEALTKTGVTILSENFFRKKWPQEELDALFALEDQSKKILPIWHRLSSADIARYAPLLADRIAVSTDIGIEAVAQAIERAVRQRGTL